MDNLEQLVQTSISSFFLQNNHNETSDSLACEIPPELLKEVIELLIAPTTVAILADFIIRKLSRNKNTELHRQAEEIGAYANEKMRVIIRRIGCGPRQSKALFDYVSKDTHVTIEILQFDDDLEEIINKIKKIAVLDSK